MDLLESVGYALAYTAVGLLVLGVGYLALDLLTPGRLGHHIVREGSINAAVITSAGLLGLGGIVFTTIWSHGDSSFGAALGWTVTFGLLGVLLQSIAFRLLDVITPDDLPALLMQPAFHPAALVAGATQVSVSLVIIASIA